MSDGSTNSARQSDPRQATAEAFRLRAEPPRVMRLSRKVLAVLMMTACVGIGGALIFALQGRDPAEGQNELFTTENRPTADALQRPCCNQHGHRRINAGAGDPSISQLRHQTTTATAHIKNQSAVLQAGPQPSLQLTTQATRRIHDLAHSQRPRGIIMPTTELLHYRL